MGQTFICLNFEKAKLCFSLLQQRKLAEYCTEIFGDMLLHQPLESWPVRIFDFFVKEKVAILITLLYS